MALQKTDIHSTKSHIIKIAENFFASKGYDNSSMSDIARELKTSKAALYYHFKNKEEIYFSVLKHALDEFEEATKKVILSKNPTEKKFKEFIVVYINFCSRNINLASLAMHRVIMSDKKMVRTAGKTRERVINAVKPLFKEVRGGVLRELKINDDMGAEFLMNMLHAQIVSKVLMPTKTLSANQIAELFWRLLFSGVGSKV